MVLRLSGAQKRMLWVFQKFLFLFFQSFHWRSWNHFLGESGKPFRTILIKFWSWKLFRKWFWSYLELKNESSKLKNNVLGVWKCHFSVFSKTLRDAIETIFWNSVAKRSELSKSKLGHRKLLGKWFWSYLELKKKCCERLKRSFFSFSTFLSDKVETIFWERETERLRQIKSKFGHRKLLIKLFCSYLELKNEVS